MIAVGRVVYARLLARHAGGRSVMTRLVSAGDKRMRRRIFVCGAFVLAVACAPPIAVRRVSSRQAQRQLTSNVLTAGGLSRPTRNLLYDRDLVERYDDDPAGALATLHGDFVA